MEKRDSKINSLYFHMGPGFHAKIEAQEFSQRHPQVAFLDQPQNVSLQNLYAWAENEIRAQYTASQKPLYLLGHSFGGQIIAAVLPRVSDMVAEVRLLNTAANSFQSFAHLRHLLLGDATTPEQWQLKSPEEKMNAILEVAQHPQFGEVYWRNPQARAHYQQLASHYPGLNIEAFIRVFNDYLALDTQNALRGFSWRGPAHIYYSLQDPLITDFKTVEPWKNVFLQAQFKEVPHTGHYSHFELPSFADEFFEL